MNYSNLKKIALEMLLEANIDEPSDVDWIAVEVFGVKRGMLAFLQDISSEKQQEFMEKIELRKKHIPVAYIFGRTEFYGYEFEVNPSVLIPRIDTEVLLEYIIEDIKDEGRSVSVLDIGTGSGAIAIVVQKETGSKVTAVDVSKEALEVAKHNAERNGAEIEFVESNVFDAIQDLKVDFIVSNPPYIETDIVKGLDSEVVDNEPILALDGGIDGLDFYREIISKAKDHLNAEGKIYFEIGYNQAETVSKLLEKDFEEIEVIKDYAGNDRVVLARLK